MIELIASAGIWQDFPSTALRLSIPILFAAIGGMYSERCGVYNIGLEGMILLGAFGSALGTFYTGQPIIGLLFGFASGLIGGLLLGLLTVKLKVDQFVGGIAVNILCIGMTAFLARVVFAGKSNTTVLNGFETFSIWPLSDLPLVGKVLFEQGPLVYLAFVLVLFSWILHSRTKWGLYILAVGNDPRAADASGIAVDRLRLVSIVFGSGIASLGGCYLVLSQVFVFTEHMSAGKGFVALAAIILGRWKPHFILLACIFFGFCDALQLRMQFQNPNVPYQAFVALPYVASILAIVILSGKSKGGPESIGKAFTRGEAK